MNTVISVLIGVAIGELVCYRKPTTLFHICTFTIATITAVKNFGIFQ